MTTLWCILFRNRLLFLNLEIYIIIGIHLYTLTSRLALLKNKIHSTYYLLHKICSPLNMALFRSGDVQRQVEGAVRGAYHSDWRFDCILELQIHAHTDARTHAHRLTRARTHAHIPPGTSKPHKEQPLECKCIGVWIFVRKTSIWCICNAKSTDYVTLAGLQLSVHMNQAPVYQFSLTQKTLTHTHTHTATITSRHVTSRHITSARRRLALAEAG